MNAGTRNTITRLVCKRAAGEADHAHHPGSGPTADELRSEVAVLARCTSPGVAVLVGHGERPVPWLETEDAGAHTLDVPPATLQQRLRALAALAHVLAGLHQDGWAHLGLEPSHVVWRSVHPPGRPSSADAPVVITLCSLGSAAHPAGPAERYADREAVAEILATALAHPTIDPPINRLRVDVAALAGELRSGDLDDLAAAAVALDDLADAAGRGNRSTSTPADVLGATPGLEAAATSRGAAAGLRAALRAGVLGVPGRARLGLIAALGIALALGTLALIANGEPSASSDPVAARCSQPTVAPPRADPTGQGCGVRVGYRSGALTVGTSNWSLGDDVIDGKLVDTDGDGWSELVALRNTGEVFLVRRFPADASQPVRVRPIAKVPGAQRVITQAGGAGLSGIELELSDGSSLPLDEAVDAALDRSNGPEGSP